ncbi:MYND-type domain-containing protein [Mycena chlorophos]|uniref:MYND-type domain-containing protein n=1 Tax=Mycena chlorophos TaxID=658473 RepID=A0A8H6W3H8_MYCCL|nr:MYND-type domain-containing protein [Mycena chlorophos]
MISDDFISGHRRDINLFLSRSSQVCEAMHPALRRTNIARLPPTIKPIAEKAAGGDIVALLHLAEGISTDSGRPIPERYRPLVAAAFYANIDVDATAYRTSAAWDNPDFSSGLSGIILSLRCFSALVGDRHVPVAAYPEVWGRVWPWAEMLDACRDHLSHSAALQFYTSVVSLMRLFWTSGSAGKSLISKTTRAMEIVGRGWVYGLEGRDDEAIFQSATMLGLDETGRPKHSKEHYYELIDGCGGTHGDLAKTIVRHLAHGFARPDLPPSLEALNQLSAVIWLLCETFHDDVELQEALLEENLVGALTRTCLSLTTMVARSSEPPSASGLPDFLGMLLTVLICIFELHMAHQYLSQAITAGLLPLIFKLLSDPKLLRFEERGERRISEFVAEFLRSDLPGFTVYRSVLLRLRKGLDTLRDFDPDVEFQERPESLEDWKRLVDMTQTRLQLVDAVKERRVEGIKMRVCDNSQCGRVRPKYEFKRCMGCRTAYYCPRECQREDYYLEDGGHREFCAELEDRFLDDFETYSPADRTFFRALLTRDYEERKEDIALKLVRFIVSHPGQYTSANGYAFPYVEFDYSGGKLRISVGSLEDRDAESESETLAELEASGYLREVERARVNAQGRTRLHVLTLNGTRGEEGISDEER